MCIQMAAQHYTVYRVVTRIRSVDTSGTSPPDGTAITAHSRVSHVGHREAVLPGSICLAVGLEKEIVSRYESRQWRQLATSPNG
jgi:hypothetical protein